MESFMTLLTKGSISIVGLKLTILILLLILAIVIFDLFLHKKQIKKLTSLVNLEEVPIKGKVRFNVSLDIAYEDGAYRGIQEIKNTQKLPEKNYSNNLEELTEKPIP